jgi:hypothetical protein
MSDAQFLPKYDRPSMATDGLVLISNAPFTLKDQPCAISHTVDKKTRRVHSERPDISGNQPGTDVTDTVRD